MIEDICSIIVIEIGKVQEQSLYKQIGRLLIFLVLLLATGTNKKI